MTDRDRLAALLDAAVERIESFPENTQLWRSFDHGRIALIGPWRFRDGIKWQAIAQPYNAGMSPDPLDADIEGVGSSPVEALTALLAAITETEVKNHD